MDIQLVPAKYVVAVSGGVDSLALLHALHQQKQQTNDGRWKLVVAHFDHGIREDSAEDRKLVQEVSRQYGLPFVYDEGKLGAGASEAEARAARYKFLRHVQRASGARSIITAHHQDDLLETAILNLLRGTGRKGLTSLASRPDISRPLLHLPKSTLTAYARDQGLRWREDSTNQDQTYLRNYIRHTILARFDEPARDRFRQIIGRLQTINNELDTLLINQLHIQPMAGTIERQWFNALPHAVAREIMATWLRENGIRDFDAKAIERLVVAAKVTQPGKRLDILRGASINVWAEHLALDTVER